MLEHARGRAVRTHGTRLSVDRADAVGFLQTVLIPSLDDARESVERILDKIEEIMSELREADMDFDFDMEFGLNDEMEMGG